MLLSSIGFNTLKPAVGNNRGGGGGGGGGGG